MVLVVMEMAMAMDTVMDTVMAMVTETRKAVIILKTKASPASRISGVLHQFSKGFSVKESHKDLLMPFIFC